MSHMMEPFRYDYMLNAMWICALVGGTCALLSVYLMLKGWSLIGDALSHSIVPGVAGAYMQLKEDVVIGLVYTSLFALGMFMISLNPTSVNIQTIVLGNILAISHGDIIQLAIIGCVVLAVLAAKWKDVMVMFFDENHARSIGIDTSLLKGVFFVLLAAATVAALQTVGACLVICVLVTPGATAYLLTDRFERLLVVAAAIGALTSFLGAYISYFADGSTGGFIVVLQTLVFLAAFFLAPKHGTLAAKRRAAKSQDQRRG